MGNASLVDSVLIGGRVPPVLAEPGAISGWLKLDNGLSRVRLVQRAEATPEQVRKRIQALQANALEFKMREYFAKLGERYPVRILDPRLRDVVIPEPPSLDKP